MNKQNQNKWILFYLGCHPVYDRKEPNLWKLCLDHNITENTASVGWLDIEPTILSNFMIMEIGLKFKYIVLVQDNVYIFKVYLLTKISSFWSCPSVCVRSKTQI